MEGDEALSHEPVAAAPTLPEVDRGPRQLPVRQRLEPGQRGAGGRHQGVVPAVRGQMKYNSKAKLLLRPMDVYNGCTSWIEDDCHDTFSEFFFLFPSCSCSVS